MYIVLGKILCLLLKPAKKPQYLQILQNTKITATPICFLSITLTFIQESNSLTNIVNAPLS
jgi:hypothetical protein